MGKVIIVGGTASTGKSTIGTRLAEHFHCSYIEGDDLHPQANIDKMANNVPLTDDDRWGWLSEVAAQSAASSEHSASGYAVVSCSALKRAYRDHVAKVEPDAKFVYVFLHAPREELVRRAEQRKGHYMKSTMIDSQLAILELPVDEENAVCIDVNEMPVDEVVQRAVEFVESQ